MRVLNVKMAVRFWDEHRVEHDALLTAVHGTLQRDEDDKIIQIPCVNLVYVSLDESKTDPYGRQVERKTSVPHTNDLHIEGPPAMCWDWMD